MYQFCPNVRMSEEFSHVSWLFKRFGPVRWSILVTDRFLTDRAWISNLYAGADLKWKWAFEVAHFKSAPAKNTAYYQKALCHTLTLPAMCILLHTTAETLRSVVSHANIYIAEKKKKNFSSVAFST